MDYDAVHVLTKYIAAKTGGGETRPDKYYGSLRWQLTSLQCAVDIGGVACSRSSIHSMSLPILSMPRGRFTILMVRPCASTEGMCSSLKRLLASPLWDCKVLQNLVGCRNPVKDVKVAHHGFALVPPEDFCQNCANVCTYEDSGISCDASTSCFRQHELTVLNSQR